MAPRLAGEGALGARSQPLRWGPGAAPSTANPASAYGPGRRRGEPPVRRIASGRGTRCGRLSNASDHDAHAAERGADAAALVTAELSWAAPIAPARFANAQLVRASDVIRDADATAVRATFRALPTADGGAGILHFPHADA